jgi:hypothetical protein
MYLFQQTFPEPIKENSTSATSVPLWLKNIPNYAVLKRIMHSARALFLTFLAPEKSKRNTILFENCSAAQDLQRSGVKWLDIS